MMIWVSNNLFASISDQSISMSSKKSVTHLYKRLEIIGRGKFGTVHKAINLETKHLVAIKILNLDTEEDEVKDVQQEIQFLSQLKSVPNVTHYYGSYLNGHKLWIIMDYCAGGSVRTLLRPGPLEEKYISIITREIFIALQFIHNHGVIHRDIKAANILISKEGKVQLCDFGVAAQLTATALKRTTMAGTPYWMAPEVITEGATYNVKADIWSTGITIYEMATGNPPYSDKDAMRAMQFITQHEPPRLEGRQYSGLMKEIIAMCLEEKPDMRPSAEELLKAKFIKNYKQLTNITLKEVIGRYLLWRDKKSSRETLYLDDDSENIHNMDETENYDIKWDFDSLKSAEYIVDNAIDMDEVDDHNDFHDTFNKYTHHYRDMTTSPYHRTFVGGSTMGNTMTATAGVTNINSQLDTTINKEAPKSLLQLFQNVDEEDSDESIINMPSVQAQDSIPSAPIRSTVLANSNSSPLIPIEIPNMALIENQIQEMEKQRSRSATVSAATSTSHLPLQNNNVVNDTLPNRRPTVSLGRRTPSPKKHIEQQANSGTLHSPSRHPSSPLQMKPLPANTAQPLLQPLNNNNKPNKPLGSLIIPPNTMPISNGPQTAPPASNQEYYEKHFQINPNSNTLNRSRTQIRIQMPVPISASAMVNSNDIGQTLGLNLKQSLNVSTSTILSDNHNINNNNSTERNQFGVNINIASNMPMSMTPVTEKPINPFSEKSLNPFLGLVSPERSTIDKFDSQKLFENAQSNLNSNNSQIERTSSSANLNATNGGSNTNLNLAQPTTVPQLSNSLGISATNGRKSSATTTSSNDSTYHGIIHSNINSVQTAPLYSSQQGDVTLTDGLLEEAGHPDFEGSNSNIEENFGASESPGKKLRKLLDLSNSSIRKITEFDVEDFENNNTEFENKEVSKAIREEYIEEIDGLLGGMGRVLELVIQQLS